MSDACRGWIDATMRMRPAMVETDDYVAGYLEGIRYRLHAAQNAINELRNDHVTRVL